MESEGHHLGRPFPTEGCSQTRVAVSLKGARASIGAWGDEVRDPLRPCLALSPECLCFSLSISLEQGSNIICFTLLKDISVWRIPCQSGVRTVRKLWLLLIITNGHHSKL